MNIRRADVATALALAAVAGISAVQWFVTTPGVITDIEFRVMLLAAGPAFVVTLTAHWVQKGERAPESDDTP